MVSGDQVVVETIRKDGIGVMRNVLSADEVAAVRLDFDQAYLDAGQGQGKPGDRGKLTGEMLLRYPALAAFYSHPRIMSVVSTMLNEPVPWAWLVSTNRYTPEHIGVRKHTDGILGELAPPFTRQSTAVFLDDVDETSGSLTYVPGTHHLHFESPDDLDRKSPTQEDVDAGKYVSTKVNAGDVVFRVPEVWHAVTPIHRLRRYVTASYVVRGKKSVGMTERVRPEEEMRPESAIDGIPERFRPLWF